MNVQGWLSHKEGLALEEFACASNNAIVEIGAFKGRSTVFLARGAKVRGGLVHVVDHFRGSPEMRKNGENEIDEVTKGESLYPHFCTTIRAFGLEDYVVPHIGWSRDIGLIWGAPIGLLFIDGSHDYKSVETDFNSWAGHVADGGLICFHDYADEGWPDVTRFVNSITGLKRLEVIDHMIVFQT